MKEHYPSRWGDFFSFTFSRQPFKSDRTQVSSSIHTLWVLDAAYDTKYLCGNIIMIRIYWQWQQGMRVSLFVPQDERVFLSLAPEALWTMSWSNGPPRVGVDGGHVWITLPVSETMIGGWIQREERMRHLFGGGRRKWEWSFVNLRMSTCSSLVWNVLNGTVFKMLKACNWQCSGESLKGQFNQITSGGFWPCRQFWSCLPRSTPIWRWRKKISVVVLRAIRNDVSAQ